MGPTLPTGRLRLWLRVEGVKEGEGAVHYGAGFWLRVEGLGGGFRVLGGGFRVLGRPVGEGKGGIH